MPQNKRESLIYTALMCFCMVLWMSMYNVTLHMGGFSLEVLKEGWLGFPIAYVFAMCCDWFLVSGLAKKFAFTYLVKPEDSVLKKVICVSCSMVVPMVLIMSMYGAVEGCVRSGAWSQLLMIWLANIPKELYHGTAIPAARSRTAGAFRIPHCIPGRKSTGIKYIVLRLIYFVTIISYKHKF